MDNAEIRISDRVKMGPNVSIYTMDHALDPIQRSHGLLIAKPVVIEEDV